MWRIPPDKPALLTSTVSFLQSLFLLNIIYLIILCKSYGETLEIFTKSQFQDIPTTSCELDNETTRADTFVPLGNESSKLTTLYSIQKHRLIEYGIPPDKISSPRLLSSFIKERSSPDKYTSHLYSSRKFLYSRLCGSTYYNVYSYSYDDTCDTKIIREWNIRYQAGYNRFN